MQRTINNTVICIRMGKNLIAKNPTGWFSSHNPETPLLSQQAVTSKGIPSTLLIYSWTFTPILNWTCSVVTVPLFDARYLSTWLTNCVDPSMQLQSPTKKIVGCKVIQFIHMMKIKKMLGHKTLQCKIHINFFKRKRWTKARTSSSVTICLSRVCSKLMQLVYCLTAFKTILLYV